ncbi:MAG: hypothetical protein HKN79_04965, partial [Flavobacteriales bacterium]|nr:hypothetical protein [Flavobacteriales bacterium]
YGYDETDLEKMNTGTGPYKNARKSIQRNSSMVQSKSRSSNYAEDFVELVESLDCEVLLVANLLGEDDDVLKMIRFFHERGIGIAGVELGNEYYLKAYWKTFPNVNAYIQRATQASDRIRAEFPDIPLGAVAASSSELKSVSMKQKLYFDNWNQGLAQEDFYDALITHVYSNKKTCQDMNTQARVDCYLEHNSDFILEIETGLQSLSSTFKGKPIWITEWNMKHVFDGLGNTSLQGLYYADFLTALAQIEEVEVATYHNLLTSSTGYNLIAKDKNRPSAKAPSHVPRAVHPVASLLAPIFDGSHRVRSFTMESIDPKKMSISVFADADTLRYVLINKTEAQLSLQSLGLDIDQGGRIHSLSSRSLGESGFKIQVETIEPDEPSSIRIAPWSVTRIDSPIK